MEGFGGIVGVSAGGKKTNPGIKIPKSIGAQRKANGHEVSSSITPSNANPLNVGLLSIVGNGMAG